MDRVVEIRALVERADGGGSPASAGMTDLVNRGGARHVSHLIPERAHSPAQVRILPVQEVALVESLAPARARRGVPACRRPTASQRSRLVLRFRRNRTTTLRLDAARFGSSLRATVVRPNSPVSMSGSPRALPCTDPSGFRIRGPTMA